jgi:UDPglucose 6-dehydrogenase
MKLAMIGAGYVGLVSGAGFAQFGNEVVCADNDSSRVAQLNRGKSPIYEPSLDDLLAENIGQGRLSFTTDVHSAVSQADVVFITVGTPQSADGSADLSAVMSTARTIGEVLRETKQPNKVVVLKSTVPVGTTHSVGKIVSSYFDKHCCVASNPEFLREGTAVEDFMRPDRIVVGTTCTQARDTLVRLYRPFSTGKVLLMDPASSELVKYSSNAYLATRISFMNEMARLATALGADIDKVRLGMGSDPRIGPHYLYPGPGYGGSCLPKDVAAIQHMADVVGQELQIVHAAQEVNKTQRHMLGTLVSRYFGNLHGKTICVWGVAFKAETDDIRESPAVDFIEDMLGAGARVVVHDPQALGSCARYFGSRVEINEDMYLAAAGADAVALCTEWRQYRNPDVQHLRSLSKNIVAFDGRNVWDRRDFDAVGVKMFSIVRRFQAESDSTLHAVKGNVKNGSMNGHTIDPLDHEEIPVSGLQRAQVG